MTRIRDRNRALILDAASVEFADKGFAAARTSDIAARAGLPKPNVYYYFGSKQTLYREVLDVIVGPLLRASEPFNRPGRPGAVLRAYIEEKIRISREYPWASKVFASEIMHGAPHLSAERTAQLNDQARHDIGRIQEWIDQGLMAPVSPHHLLFSIWAATQTYADFDWQVAAVTGKTTLDDTDYRAATDTILRLVLNGCDVVEP